MVPPLGRGKTERIFSVYFDFTVGILLLPFRQNYPVKPTFFMKLDAALWLASAAVYLISGPPASLFYLAATDTKEEYLGTLNAFFSFTVILI